MSGASRAMIAHHEPWWYIMFHVGASSLLDHQHLNTSRTRQGTRVEHLAPKWRTLIIGGALCVITTHHDAWRIIDAPFQLQVVHVDSWCSMYLQVFHVDFECSMYLKVLHVWTRLHNTTLNSIMHSRTLHMIRCRIYYYNIVDVITNTKLFLYFLETKNMFSQNSAL